MIKIYEYIILIKNYFLLLIKSYLNNEISFIFLFFIFNFIILFIVLLLYILKIGYKILTNFKNNILLNDYPLYITKSHDTSYFMNPRGFIRTLELYTKDELKYHETLKHDFLLEENQDNFLDIDQIRIDFEETKSDSVPNIFKAFFSTLDFYETRLIYKRLDYFFKIYFFIYKKYKNLMDDDNNLISYRLHILLYKRMLKHCFNMKVDLKNFYRTFNNIESSWMSGYNFKMHFLDYKKSVIFLKDILIKIKLEELKIEKLKVLWNNIFLKKLLSSNNKKIIELNNFLIQNFNTKLENLSFDNLKIEILKNIYKFIIFNNLLDSKEFNWDIFFLIFNHIQSIVFLKEESNKHYIIIQDYWSIVDSILQQELNTFFKETINDIKFSSTDSEEEEVETKKPIIQKCFIKIIKLETKFYNKVLNYLLKKKFF